MNDKQRELLFKLKNGSMSDIFDIYHNHFHEIKHTESFGVLADRLIQEMDKNYQLKKDMEFFKQQSLFYEKQIEKLSKYFAELRFSKTNHIGLGDIRLTIGQQEKIIKELKNEM
jgi:hypothetical protein